MLRRKEKKRNAKLLCSGQLPRLLGSKCERDEWLQMSSALWICLPLCSPCMEPGNSTYAFTPSGARMIFGALSSEVKIKTHLSWFGDGHRIIK